MPEPNQARQRCPWSLGVNDLYIGYHDHEWGVPVRDDQMQFEFLILEGAQAGLSWSTVLNKREGYREAFDGFDAERIARYTAQKERALLANPAIIRNRLKVAAAITNARAYLEIQDALGSFSEYLWGFVDGRPVQNRWQRQEDVPATSRQSDALSRDLKKRGFKFVGSTIMYAHMQATGMVNDHILGCYRHAECAALA
jgi:DNA-3-methyladenine glycosylase I